MYSFELEYRIKSEFHQSKGFSKAIILMLITWIQSLIDFLPCPATQWNRLIVIVHLFSNLGCSWQGANIKIWRLGRSGYDRATFCELNSLILSAISRVKDKEADAAACSFILQQIAAVEIHPL